MSFELTTSGSSTRCRRSAAVLAGSLLIGGIAPASAQLDFDLPRFEDWAADTVVLDAPALDGAGAGCPIETPDGLVLYTARRDSTGAFSSLDIWLNMRLDVDQPFEAAVRLPAPTNALDHADFSTAGQAETRPSISRDGRRLVWGSGGIIHESQREIDDDCFRFVLQPTCD